MQMPSVCWISALGTVLAVYEVPYAVFFSGWTNSIVPSFCQGRVIIPFKCSVLHSFTFFRRYFPRPCWLFSSSCSFQFQHRLFRVRCSKSHDNTSLTTQLQLYHGNEDITFSWRSNLSTR
ncbi:uncharacterized protein BJ212DRAFT_313753 [Suillus subaureus]|uniref:Uncharacterized protein n=1 Tax=Suillus subaureus TaxID=48587 RepID=A0A9P7JJK0_9AGAM|nr:uncharacterized protein BJ212DRAFT_313753 [Suillus subaureus]KAG1825956.1 hypothetical protein BJ212DRAFT_313753 [Suillus subaureus]